MRRKSLAAMLAAGMAVVGGSSVSAQMTASSLGAYNIRPDKIFVAGISSGGFMAVQMHVAYSHLFKGAAIYAGGPYYCAQGSVYVAIVGCEENLPATTPSGQVYPPPNPAVLEAVTEQWARQGLIDPVRNLQRQPVYLWSGLADKVVTQAVMNDLQAYYQYFGADVFHYDNNFDAGHAWESPDGSNACPVTASPYVNKCDNSDRVSTPTGSGVYDSEQVWLTRFLGTLAPRNDGTLGGTMLSFDQDQFAPGGSATAISMAPTGYAFVPADCAAGAACGLVLALHGCNQYYGAVGSAFIDKAGLNEWADTNHIVVLYPQTTTMSAPSDNPTDIQDSNPQGCWNWWGYLHDPTAYAQKGGAQMQALHAMVMQAASGAPSASPDKPEPYGPPPGDRGPHDGRPGEPGPRHH